MGEDFSIFNTHIDPCDIIQGSLGNCYFLSALSAMAEFPDRIKRIFASATTNQSGCYAANFCLNGSFKEILVDDLLPCYPSSRAPLGFK